MSQQQTVLRVETNLPGSIVGLTEWSSGTTYGSDVLVSYNNLTYVSIRPDNTNNTPIVGGSLWWDEVGRYEFLDLYSSIPLLINKSFAELGDIGKRNSDYSVGVLLPGSKRNNAFFESYFNVDSVSFFFNPNKRVPCNVLINDEPYFTGYMRLNKVSVMDSKTEYEVTLYSTPAELYGSIGNNLLRDLNFSDDDYRFNHTFNLNNVTKGFTYPNYAINGENPYPYFYPVVHNGYLYYTGDTVNFSDGFIKDRTNLYTSTAPLGSFATLASAYAAGVQQHRINSPTQGLYNNQLKPALNIWSLLQLMFKTYGFSIESDFFNTPWMKTLYLYGYFSSDTTKFGYTVYSIQTLPLEGCEVFFVEINLDGTPTVYSVVCKLGTGIPCYCSSDINVTFHYSNEYNPDYTFDATIPYGTSGLTIENIGIPFNYGTSSQVPNGTTLKYLPVSIGDTVSFVDDDFVDFNLVIDQNIKQIDILSSIAKKFNLVLIPDPSNGYNIRIEPYDYYIGTGNVHNWSDKISFDKGFTVEPALNFIESELRITDQEDNDEGNKLFKESNNRIYGQNYVYNPTDFKTEVKEINTIFSPELIRKWDADGESNIGLPLGINYVGSNNQIASGTSERVNWIYKGVKTKPKLFWWLGSFNPFLDLPGEHYDATYYYKTYVAYVMNSSGTTYNQYDKIPVISHTMPMGNPDSNKSGRGFENDSQCILFNSELPANTDIGVQPFNTYTENDAYTSFYEGRVSNLYNPNTRVVSGYFNLNYADLKNLEPQDLIKINEQYFVVSKIEGFNLTNRELTKVQLVQFNGQPNTYPTRCFEYYYCDDPTTVYTFSTDFTNSNLLDTNFGWSLYYDHQIGNLGGSATGFTSTFKDVENFSTEVYIPYYIYEVKCGQTTGALDWGCDCLHNYIWSEQFGPFQYNMPSFWLNSDSTETGVNLFTDCADFYTTATTYDIVTGSSSNRGNFCCCSMSGGTGFNNSVFDIEIQADNKILVAGAFTQYSGVTVDKLCRLNVDGTLDNTFNYNDGTTFTNIVSEILIQPDQKILRRDFNTLIRLNTDGSNDSTFDGAYWNTTGQETAYEEVLGLQSDGKIIVGGRFTSFTASGVTSTKLYIQRLNTNGTIDATFNSAGTGFTATTGTTTFRGVQDVLVLPDDKILVAGKFSSYNGTVCDNLIKLNADGTIDGTFTIDTTPNDTYGILDIEIQSDGKILVGIISGIGAHQFTYLGYNVYGLFRLNSDGTFDTSFPYNVWSGSTFDINVLNDDSMYIGGQNGNAPYDTYSGTVVSNIFKLTSSGVLDTYFNTGTGINNTVWDIEIQNNNRILVGGAFTSYNGVIANRFINLNKNGSTNMCSI